MFNIVLVINAIQYLNYSQVLYENCGKASVEKAARFHASMLRSIVGLPRSIAAVVLVPSSYNPRHIRGEGGSGTDCL